MPLINHSVNKQSDGTYLLWHCSKKTGAILRDWLSVQVQAGQKLVHCRLCVISTTSVRSRRVRGSRLFLAFDVRRRHSFRQDCRLAVLWFILCLTHVRHGVNWEQTAFLYMFRESRVLIDYHEGRPLLRQKGHKVTYPAVSY